MQNVKKLLVQSPFMKGVLSLGLGSVLGQSILLLVLPVLTRLYSTDDLGQFGLFFSYLTLISAIACLRYDVAVVSTKRIKQAIDLSVLACSLSIIIALLASILLAVFQGQHVLGFGYLPNYAIPIMFLAIMVTANYQVFRYFAVRKQHYHRISVAVILQNIGRASGQVLLGLLNPILFGLIIGDLGGRALALWCLGKTFFQNLKSKYYRLSLKRMLKAGITYRDFLLFSAPSALVNALFLSLPIPLLTMVYGIGLAGIYTLVNRLLAVPVYFVGNSVADVFHGQVAALSRKRGEDIKRLFLKTTAILLLLGLIPFTLLALLSPFVFAIIFGAKWQQGGIIVSAMCPWMLSQFVVSPVSRVVFITGKQYIKLIYDGVALMGLLVSILLGKLYALKALQTILLMSFAGMFSYIIYLCLLYYSVNCYHRDVIKLKANESL